MPDGPLNGVRILDLTHVWAGPLAVRMLADMGAEVVRIEAPFGRGPQAFPYAPLGGWVGGAAGERPWDANAIFVKLMRNRQSVCVDLKADAGRELFLRLVEVVDVVMENFSARAMPELNLDYDTLRAANPRLIHVAMPGFGLSGPLKDRVAFGPTVEPMSGLTAVFGYGPDEPRNTAMALMDPITGANAFAAVTAALRRRALSGKGCQVELSLHEGGVAYSGPWLIDQQLGNEVTSIGNRHPHMVPHGVFSASGDDRWVAIACPDDLAWQSLASRLDMPEAWPLGERRRREGEIERRLSGWCAVHSANEIVECLQADGVPAGAVNAAPEFIADPQTQARGFFVPYERHATPMPGNAIKHPMLDSAQWTPCPDLGADNEKVLEDWLGIEPGSPDAARYGEVLFNKPPA